MPQFTPVAAHPSHENTTLHLLATSSPGSLPTALKNHETPLEPSAIHARQHVSSKQER